MEPSKPKLYLQMFGCLFALVSLVGIPFYIATAAKWEKLFGVGGIIGYLLMQSTTFVLPLSVSLLTRQTVIRAMSRLPKTMVSIILVCLAGLMLSFVPRWASTGQAKAWRLLGTITTCAIQVGVLLGAWQSYGSVTNSRR